MARYNKVVCGYVIQVFDTEVGDFVSQEFVPEGDIFFEDEEDGASFSSPPEDMEGEYLALEMVQPVCAPAPPLVPETTENKIKWVKWYRKTHEGVGLKEACGEYQRRVTEYYRVR